MLLLTIQANGQQPSNNGSAGPLAWGLHGETWNRARLLDWSWAGYAGKERPYPDPPIVVNVLDFGAVGDGKFDNIGPIKAAIAAAKSVGGGTVLLPAGRYLVSNRIDLDGNGLVLKGEGPNKTTLYFPEPLSELDGVKVEDSGSQSPYSWLTGWIKVGSSVKDPGSADRSTFLGATVESSVMGSRTLTLSSTAGLVPGQWVRLLMSDYNGELVKSLYGRITKRLQCGEGKGGNYIEDCISDMWNERDLVRWAVRIVAINGNQITLQKPLPLDVGLKAEIHKISPTMIRESGVRNMTLEFKWSYAAPHLHEQGYNALYFENTINCFATNVTTLNTDSGIMVANSNHVSIDGVVIGVTKSRGKALPFDGHIGIGSYDSSDIEFANFKIDGEWIHDVTVRGTLMTVFHNGKGHNINLDSHRSGPYATLWSNINLGRGTRPFGTGGYRTRGFPAGQYTTYYNLRTASSTPIHIPNSTFMGMCTWGSRINLIGSWKDGSCPGYYIESYKPNTLHPIDLYGSMVDRKFSNRVNGIGDVPLPNDNNSTAVVPSAGDGTYPVITAPDVY